MSTRGAIALPTRDGWRGRYHHFDSYPTGLGRELFRLYHHTFRDHRDMATVLIDQHPAGWCTIMSDSAEGPFTRVHFEHSGYTSIDSPAHGHYPECFCHGTRNEPEDRLVCRCPTDTAGCAPVFIEWAYLLTSFGMNVLTSWHPDPNRDLSAHRPIARVPWQGEEPDWAAIEHRAWHHPPRSDRAQARRSRGC